MRVAPASDGKHIHVLRGCTGEPQTFGHRASRYTRDVLDPSKPLLFEGRHERAIRQQCRRDVAVVGIEPENQQGEAADRARTSGARIAVRSRTKRRKPNTSRARTCPAAPNRSRSVVSVNSRTMAAAIAC